MLILIFCMNAICVNAKDYFVDGQKAFDAGNYAEAINNFEAGANAGSGSCCAKIALMHLGVGLPLDLSKARFWAHKGIELNSARCYGIMGLTYMYETDMTTGKGMEGGLPYLIKAYELKDTDTEMEFFGNCGINIATIYLVARDNTNGKHWLDRLVKDFSSYPALLGQASYFYLALNDYDSAIKYASVADRQSNIYAAYVLGYCLAYGKGIIQNKTSGFKYMKRAALSGLPDGAPEYMLGIFYQDGIGTVPDIEKAKYWYGESARKNNPNAVAKLKT